MVGQFSPFFFFLSDPTTGYDGMVSTTCDDVVEGTNVIERPSTCMAIIHSSLPNSNTAFPAQTSEMI